MTTECLHLQENFVSVSSTATKNGPLVQCNESDTYVPCHADGMLFQVQADARFQATPVSPGDRQAKQLPSLKDT